MKSIVSWKKIGRMFLGICMIFALTACGAAPESKETGTTTETEKKTLTSEKEEPVYDSDATRFKEEYESYNNYKREDGVTLWPVEIPEENPYVYVTMEEAIQLKENGTGVLFIGSADCRLCRMLATLIIDAVNQEEAQDKEYIRQIYYLDPDTIDTEDSIYPEFQEKVLQPIASYLEKYEDPSTNIYGIPELIAKKAAATEEDSKQVTLYKYTLSYWNQGKLLGMHVGTTPYYTDSDTPPTQQDQEEFVKRFQEITSLFGTDLCKYC